MINYQKIEEYLEKAKGIEQTSMYHLENLYVHTLRCADYLLKNTNSVVYTLAGLLHDTGKVETQRKKGDKYTFYGHAKQSAINLKKYITPDDIYYKPVYDIIFCHMMYYDCVGHEIKFLKNNGYEENFKNNVDLFNIADENACIRDKNDLISDKDCDIIKNRVMKFLIHSTSSR